MSLDLISTLQLAGCSALISHAIFKRINFTSMGIPIALLIVFPTLSLTASSYIENASPTFRSVLANFAFYYLCLSVSILAYRLSPLHPLYQFPGPRLARVSKLYGVWASATGKQHRILKQLHDVYGPVVRTGPNELSISDVDGVMKVLGANGLPKGEFYDARSDPHSPNNIVNLSGDEHANRRRIWNRGFSTESLREYEDMIARRAEQLIEKIGAIDGPVDLSTWLSFFQFDFMGDMAFSGGFEMLRASGDEEGIRQVLCDYFHVAALTSHVPWVAKTLAHLPVLPERMMKLFTFGAERASRRIKNGSLKKDLWYHLTDEAGLEKEKPPVSNVIPDGALAIVAGGDTTARAIQNLFFAILAHPAYYERLKNELDTAFPHGEGMLDVGRYSELKFLDALINETLRMYPPVPTNGPRRVPDASKARVICDKFVPEGTEIYVPPYVIHRDARYFSPSPDTFIPERWMTREKSVQDAAKSPASPSVLNTAAYIPFSFGPQNCVGRNLARNEIKMVVALLLSRYDFRFADGFDKDDWEDSLCDYFIMHPDKPLLVTLTRR